MSEKMKSWDLSELSVIVGGLPIEGGAGEGSFVRIERPTKAVNISEGADGSIVAWKSNSKYRKVTINLLQTSSGNATLSALHQISQNTPGGVTFPIMIRDRQGLSVLIADQAIIEDFPDAEYAQAPTNREWVIHVKAAVEFEGGN